ncbi:MAG: pyridoxal phosphate-dependent aminotransferase [Desulfovibrio sp.]|nr:pyridoxal phosphate-dependent aminotransferase [Desulfovibrio sp.]
MRVSDRVSAITPSVTLSINSKALAMRKQGIAIQSLAVGEPDFPTPAHICQAAKDAIDQGFTRYTAVAGIPELRQACADYFASEHGVRVPAEAIVVGAGGKHCLYTFFQATVNPGDQVLIPSPYWLSYPDMVQLAGGEPVFIPTKAQDAFKVTPAMLDPKLTPKTRILVLNSPSNPTGSVYTAKELDALIEWAIDHDLIVLSDEIYEQLVYTGTKNASALPWFAKKPDNIAIANGLSKSFAMTGWRMGFLATHPDCIKKMAALMGHCTSNICSITQKAALAALTGSRDCIEEMRKAYVRRRDLAYAIVQTWPDVICPKPDGAFYLFADVHAYYSDRIPDSTALCSYLLDHAHVALVPGAAFGDDNCIRFSYAVDDAALLAAFERVGSALLSLRNHG